MCFRFGYVGFFKVYKENLHIRLSWSPGETDASAEFFNNTAKKLIKTGKEPKTGTTKTRD